MPPRQQSLSRRIVASFVLMTLVVAGVFSLTVVLAVSYTEQNYASTTMGRTLDDILTALDKGRPFQLDEETLLFVGGPGGPALPQWLDGIRPGFQEVSHEDRELHVLVRDAGDSRYVLVQNPEEFERRENVLYAILAGAFLLSVLAAWGLGLLMASRVIAPVVRLSGQVQRREQQLAMAPPLAADYPDDEVGRLAMAFDATLGQLRQALERERLFTSDVSHELRTPLMVIASSCDLLLEQGLADAAQQAQVRRIHASCMEMRELVETFLDLAREPESQSRGDGGVAALAAIAEETLERFRGEADARGLDLSMVREDGDAGRYPAPLLRAVLSNLLRNALHYTDRGYVRLVLRNGGFSVCDSGIGIPSGARESMFRPFVRGDASRGDGLGLGLSLVQRICQRQGWRIRLEEHRDGGCEFRVDFSS